MTEMTGEKSEMVAITQRLDDQLAIIHALQDTIAMQMQTIILLKNDILNLSHHVAFLTRQVGLVADVESYNEFKHTKTH
jgi:hypothetical protein